MTTDRVYQQAVRRARRLMARARQLQLREPTAAVLATATRDARPSVRTVLLKQIDESGVTFFTHLNSRKGRQLAANPRAALCVFVDRLMEQLTIEGAVQRLSDADADAYWATRDRTSQLGAWASRQSEAMDSRLALAARMVEARRRFAGGPIPRPPHWSGFRLAPDRIEFWKARRFRLNERVVYAREGGRWTIGLLYP